MACAPCLLSLAGGLGTPVLVPRRALQTSELWPTRADERGGYRPGVLGVHASLVGFLQSSPTCLHTAYVSVRRMRWTISLNTCPYPLASDRVSVSLPGSDASLRPRPVAPPEPPAHHAAPAPRGLSAPKSMSPTGSNRECFCFSTSSRLSTRVPPIFL
ncbi:hypothetical protein C8Q79DRAFT_439284 [Trametes meyenii]|nr:hypothetical protein C8Q79DRAFT_439284 [Trametes meyenii]